MIALPATRAAGLVVALAAVTALGASPTLADTSAPSPTPPAHGNLAQAGLLARSLGERVEATDLTTESEQFFANPDGTTTAELHTEPVRARSGGTWVDLDLTLRVGADGLVRPRAGALDVAFSGGGSAPLATIRRNGTSSALSWTGTLPTPTLVGPSATYPEVLPGVDVVVTAVPDGYREVVVVKDRKAASNPAVRQLSLGLDITHGRTAPMDDGGYTVVGDNGAEVFTSSRATMWDSRGNAAPQGPRAGAQDGRAVGPLDNDHVRPVAQGVTARAIALTPDASMLDSADTVYPVYIDPTKSAAQYSRAMIDAAYPDQEYYNWSGDQGSGYQNFSGWSRKRLFFRFTTPSGVSKTHILKATMTAYETYASQCNSETVEAWRTGAFSSSTNWTNGSSVSSTGDWQAKLTTISTAAGRSDCYSAGRSYDFNVTTGVATYAAAGASAMYFGLKATDETDPLAWRRFRSDVKLSIEYNTKPSTPAASGMKTTSPSTTCVTGSARPVVNDPTPVLVARLNDVDNDSVYGQFDVFDITNTTSTPNIQKTSVTKTANADFSPSTAFTLTNLKTYKWRVRTWDGHDWSSYSPFCELTIDTSAPTPPVIQDPGTIAMATPVTFTVTLPTDAKSAKWSLNIDAPVTALDMTTRQFTITPSATGPQVVRAWAYDAAGNVSPKDAFTFVVDGAKPADRWALNEGAGSIADSKIRTNPFTLSGGFAWIVGEKDQVCTPEDPADCVTVVDRALDLSPGVVATTGSATTNVKTANNFTVMAKVRPEATTTRQVILQEAASTTASAFYLGVNKVTANSLGTFDVEWVFGMPNPSGGEKVLTWTEINVQPGEWKHVAGRYEAATHTLDLVVDGVEQATGALPATTSSLAGTSAVQLGRVYLNGAASAAWSGDVDEVVSLDGWGDDDLIYTYASIEP